MGARASWGWACGCWPSWADRRDPHRALAKTFEEVFVPGRADPVVISRDPKPSSFCSGCGTRRTVSPSPTTASYGQVHDQECARRRGRPRPGPPDPSAAPVRQSAGSARRLARRPSGPGLAPDAVAAPSTSTCICQGARKPTACGSRFPRPRPTLLTVQPRSPPIRPGVRPIRPGDRGRLTSVTTAAPDPPTSGDGDGLPVPTAEEAPRRGHHAGGGQDTRELRTRPGSGPVRSRRRRSR